MTPYQVKDILYAKISSTDVEDVMHRLQCISEALDYCHIDLDIEDADADYTNTKTAMCIMLKDATVFAEREIKRLKQYFQDEQAQKKFNRNIDFNNALLSDEIRESGLAAPERNALALRVVSNQDLKLLQYDKVISNIKVVEESLIDIRKRLKQTTIDIKEMWNVTKDWYIMQGRTDYTKLRSKINKKEVQDEDSLVSDVVNLGKNI